VNDDYAEFVNKLVVPLARANSTTLTLDNVGHGEGGHPRGASAKSDLNEVVFQLSAVEPFNGDTRGKVIWRRKRQRFSGVPVAMEQVIGGGTFELPKPLDQEQEGEPKPFRPTYLMEQVSRLIETEPGKSGRYIDEHISGKRSAVTTATQRLLEEGFFRSEPGPHRSQLYYSITPYREVEDNANGVESQWFPSGSPSGSQGSAVPPDPVVPPSGSSPRGRTTGTTDRGTGSRSGSREPSGTTEPPPDSDPPLFGAGVEEADAPAQPSDDGYHHLTEEEYAERFLERQAREAERIREDGIEGQ
jgi:hypothetical protein